MCAFLHNTSYWAQSRSAQPFDGSLGAGRARAAGNMLCSCHCDLRDEKKALASRGSTVPPWARASGCRGARDRSAMPCTYMVVVAETVKRNEEGVPKSPPPSSGVRRSVVSVVVFRPFRTGGPGLVPSTNQVSLKLADWALVVVLPACVVPGDAASVLR